MTNETTRRVYGCITLPTTELDRVTNRIILENIDISATFNPESDAKDRSYNIDASDIFLLTLKTHQGELASIHHIRLTEIKRYKISSDKTTIIVLDAIYEMIDFSGIYTVEPTIHTVIPYKNLIAVIYTMPITDPSMIIPMLHTRRSIRSGGIVYNMMPSEFNSVTRISQTYYVSGASVEISAFVSVIYDNGHRYKKEIEELNNIVQQYAQRLL